MVSPSVLFRTGLSNHASKFFLILSLFSVVIVTPFTIFPFVVGKILFFRLCVEWALLFFLLANYKTYRTYKSYKSYPLIVAVTIFVFIFSLAGFLGYDGQTSFWSNFIRGEGVFQMWHYYIFFLLAIYFFKDEKSWRQVLYYFLVASFLTIILGIPAWIRDYHLDARFKGTIGNPAFLATYLFFGLFFGFYLLKGNPPNFRKVTFLKWGLLGICFLMLGAFILTGTRGAFLGLMAGVILFLIIFSARKILNFKTQISYKVQSPKPPTFLLFGFGTLFVICVLSVGFLFYYQPARIFQISLKEHTAQTRLWTWESAIKGWQDRPLLGWGPENFSAVFDKYFDARHYDSPDISPEVWFDRAHNVFVDYLTETGILGLLAYLGIWVVYYFELFRKKSLILNLKSLILFTAFPIAYLVQGSLIFETLPAYMPLFLFLALANYELENSKHEAQNPKQYQNTNVLNFEKFNYSNLFRISDFGFRIFIVMVIIIIIVACYFGIYRPLVKSILFNNALAQIDKISSVEEFKNNFSPALDYWSPYGQDEELKMLGGVMLDLFKKNPPQEVARALADYLNKYYEPVLARGHGNMFAENYYILGRVNASVGNNELVKKYYQEATIKWPARPEFNTGIMN